ncbi:Angiopoietin-related protein 6 [Mytilus coruscus]|uniref:Angiopoietin-related protein 6 n=1 Tax=Mytilus coruscus TaxID=42192 RepID=A0A6J7ZYY7_MYTCO|nr:Angiopoietin-related protein 6 [Mytilus coruscus]
MKAIQTSQISSYVYSRAMMSFFKGADCRDGPTTARDCADIQSQGCTCSGVYNINISSQITVNVWCDLHTDGGRWTVNDKHGFGDPYAEYWIGNDNLYTLTKSGRTELLILMETWDGSYSEFYISDESDNYRLGLSGFSGIAGDSLMDKTMPQAGHQFSTRDQDNDNFSGSCNPSYHLGGFWFNRCGRSDLNGY